MGGKFYFVEEKGLMNIAVKFVVLYELTRSSFKPGNEVFDKLDITQGFIYEKNENQQGFMYRVCSFECGIESDESF